MQEDAWYDLFTMSKDTAKCIMSAKQLRLHIILDSLVVVHLLLEICFEFVLCFECFLLVKATVLA